MAKKLIIVESPAKAKTLEKFLGKDYKVDACGGHIRDLPPKKLGVDIKHDFDPQYVTIKGKDQIIKKLKSEAQKASLILLAPDPDREGEAIAWHLTSILADKSKIKRIEFNEITERAVKAAVKNPREIDIKRVDAQQARRVLDRLVGYKISPILWKKVRKGLSAGRVQSVTVKLICKREKEIQAFKAVEYWSLTALLKNQEQKEFKAKLIQIELPNEEKVKNILAVLEGAEYQVKKITRREVNRYPAPPFITSTMQQEASRRFGFSAKKTMTIAQKLYEGIEIKGEGQVGLITYMRTDSTRLAQESKAEAREFIQNKYGANYLPKHAREFKKKKQAQDAHEAIRPTSVGRAPEKIKQSLNPDQFKIYQMIWNRFVASQMSSALLEQVSVDILAREHIFRAAGSVVRFEGFKVLYEEMKEKATGEEEEENIPTLKEGEILALISLLPKQHFTEPPPRYTEASLIKELESRGIGRPSTYAPILGTIVERGYVIKEGRTLSPTELGILINGLLIKHFPEVVDVKFTAAMEADLDKILEGKMSYLQVLNEFYTPFAKDLAKAEVEMKKIKTEKPTNLKCEQCGQPLVIRAGRFGEFLACSTYPKCKFTKNLPGAEDKIPAEQKTCEKCGKPMVLKRSRFGEFLACSGYPQCKNVDSLLKKIGVICPLCGGEIIEKKTRKKRIFFSCSKYPQCKFSVWDKPAGKKCPKCGGVLLEKKSKGQLAGYKCMSKECGHQEGLVS